MSVFARAAQMTGEFLRPDRRAKDDLLAKGLSAHTFGKLISVCLVYFCLGAS